MTMRVRVRLEYKGEKDDVELPGPLSVELDEGSTIIDLLRNAARFHQEYVVKFTVKAGSRYLHYVQVDTHI